jgi:predicted amidohydrolase YtcJ
MLLALAVVLTHAHVLTQSPAQPVASTVAIVDGRIAYVGPDAGAALRAAGGDATIVDVQGRTVIPGFDDAHAHFGLSLTLGGQLGIELPALDKKAFIAALASASRDPARAAGEWLFVTTRTLPTGIARGRDLDFLARPVFVVTEHGGIVNRRAAVLGRFTHDEAPDGFIRGRELPAAIARAVRTLPHATLVEGAAAFSAELSRLGITSVQLIGDELPDVFEELRQQRRLTARVRLVPLGYRFSTPLYHSEWRGPAPDWVRVDGVKYFHDDWARISRFELQELYDDATHAGRRVVLHVLSRRALQSFLDALTRMSAAHPDDARLFRVDHADEVTREQAERLAKLGIIVCANPAMLPEWRSEHAFPLHTLLGAGVRLCIGTDWLGRHTPRRPLSPLESLQLAVTHGGFGTGERISPAEALAAYTQGSASAEGQEEDKGAIIPGMFGDLVVLSGDPTAVAPEKISELEVLLTMVGGRVVYRQGSFGLPTAPPTTIDKPRPPQPPTIGPVRAQPPTIGPPRPPGPATPRR